MSKRLDLTFEPNQILTADEMNTVVDAINDITDITHAELVELLQ